MRHLKLLLFTSDKVSIKCLEAVAAGGEVAGVVQAGPPLRPLRFIASPVEHFAGSKGPFFQHDDLKKDAFKEVLAQTDLLISVGYGRIIPSAIFSVPIFGAMNLHPAYLPQYRGKHPDIYAIMNGEREAGITLHYVDTGIDTGDVISQAKVPILESDTIASLSERLYGEGARLLSGAFAFISTHERRLPAQPQRPPDTHPLSTRIDWEDSAKRIHNVIRALVHPWPMAYTRWRGEVIYLNASRVLKDGRTDSPGKVLAVRPDGIVIGAGVDSVLVSEVRLGDGGIFSGEDVAQAIGIRVNDTFE